MAIEGGRQGPVWLLGLPAPLLEMQKERPIFFFFTVLGLHCCEGFL